MARVNLHPDQRRQPFVQEEHHSRIRGKPNGGDDRPVAVILRHHREGPRADCFKGISINAYQAEKASNHRDGE